MRVLNEEGFREAAQRDKDSWDTMASKVPTNHVEKNLYLLSQAARLTIDNTCLLPNPLRKKVTAQYHRTISQNNNIQSNTEHTICYTPYKVTNLIPTKTGKVW